MAEETGSKLAGAMNRSPSMAGLRRVSPGIFRDAKGQLVTSGGKPIPRQPQQPQQPPQQAMPRPLVQQPQQMGQAPMGAGAAAGIGAGLGNMPAGQPGQVGNQIGELPSKPSTNPFPDGMQAENLKLVITPEEMARRKAEYDAAVNYQPGYQESQPRGEMGFLQRKKFADMAKRRERIINSPFGSLARYRNPTESSGGEQQ